MVLEPVDLLEKLEFDKVITLLDKMCFGQPGKDLLSQIRIETDLERIQTMLRQTLEYKIALEEKDLLPMSAYQSILEDLKMLEIEGFVLSEESLVNLNIILRFTGELFGFFTEPRRQAYPELLNITRQHHFDKELMLAIERVIDEEGNIRADASPQLQRIRREISNRQRELDKVFRDLANTYRAKGWLTDNVESFRNGRRVLSVPAEHKRKIRGIIHDESATGKTAFIEPEAVIDINNDIFDLFNEEKREIYRILKELSAVLRPYVPQMRGYESLIAQFDLIQTKAQLAMQMRAGMPRIEAGPRLGIQMGYHPLLLLKNKGLGRETVPFDLTLYGKNRILLLSGPNAGGKSVTMKSVGLIQLMLQAGMLVPVDEISEMGIFHRFFADIGDQQSLEEDLSTYSSRLINMRKFMEGATPDTLMLIDEFGSGTDPLLGGAIAEALLKEFVEAEAHAVITTHYSNLKIFAFNTPGIVNGCMLYDSEQLTPTYQLKVGRPGSSYAFEIAQKSGLPNRVLKYARHRAGKNEKAVDELLVDLQRERQELLEKLDSLSSREAQLERLIKNYDQLHRDLEYRRKKLKLDIKEQTLQQSSQEKRDLEKLIRQLREEKNLERAQEIAEERKVEQQKLQEQVTDLREDIYYKPQPGKKDDAPIQVGDYVRMRTGLGATGQVESIQKDKAVLLVGQMRMTFHLRDLEKVGEQLEVQRKRSIQTDILDQNSQFETRIDIRGMRLEESLQILEDFVDKALLSNAELLRIIHGKGSGVLRKAVKKKLKEFSGVGRVYHPEQNAGGDGVTLVELKANV
jgi:DNA mismatch repair protein MutS2